MAWYIDTWAVADGLAFASRREPDSIEAAATVFFAPPRFRPVPIGRISTALRAGRGPFQERLRTEDGEEVPFASLAEVREAVRRGFLAGGGGLPGPGDGTPFRPGPGPQGPEPERPTPQSGEGSSWPPPYPPLEPEPGDSELWEGIRRQLVEAPRAAWLDLSTRVAPDTFAGHLAALASCSLHRWTELAHTDPRARRSLRKGVAAFVTATVLDPPAFFEFERLLRYESFPYRGFPDSWWEGRRIHEIVADGILYAAPLPHVPGWSPEVRTLGDKLHLSLSSPSLYYARNVRIAELAPALLSAMIVVGAADPRWDLDDSERRLDVLRRACQWLGAASPAVNLPEAVETSIHDFAWQWLGHKNAHSG